MRNALIAIAALVTAIAIVTRNRVAEPRAPAAQPRDTVPSAPLHAESAAVTARGDTAAAAPVGGAANQVPTGAASAPAGTQPGTQTGSSEPQSAGEAALLAASRAYSGIRSLRAEFVQRLENPLLGSSVSSRGVILQRRPDLFKMRFTEPAGDLIVSDGRHFWIYYPSLDAQQVIRAPLGAGGAGGVDLQSQFLGDPLRRFSVRTEGRESVDGRAATVVTLTPRENLGYRRLKVWIDERDHLVRRFELTENNDNVRHFQLRALQVNPAIAESEFRFTPPAGARVVEQG